MDLSLLGFHWQEILNVHPVFVHVPIVLFPVSLVCYVLTWRRPSPPLRAVAQGLLVAATVGAGAAVLSGLRAAGSFPHTATLHHLMETHETVGYVIVGSGLLLSIWSFRRRAELPIGWPGFLLLLAFVSLAVTLNADLGGRMVYVHGAGVRRPPAVEDASHNHETHDHDAAEHHHD